MVDRRIRRTVPVAAAVVAALAISAPPATAARGAAELSLDRTATAALVEAALSGPYRRELEGFGPVTIELGSPRSLAFRDGGIETTIPVRIAGSSLAAVIEARFVPAIDRLTGQIRLESEYARPAGAWPLPLDFAALFEPVGLPQRLSWTIELERAVGLRADCFVQGLEIGRERLVLLLALELSAPGRPPVSSSSSAPAAP
ncbi:MAG TPA: hypothetical protein VD788_05505 [Candidatus Polarisedimenticolaceae bacterium]|nr:hypothetical protein [Candidatus Polarisedimenticolaceae bacterium]